MSTRLKLLATIIVAFILGTLYAGLIGVVAYQLRGAFISWPIWIMLFWFLFWKFDLLYLSGYFAVLPLAILGFEVVRTLRQPPQFAYQLTSLDRSHYRPRTRLQNPNALQIDPHSPERVVTELYIGDDGFRADPETQRGNPARCREVLIGDSMIYGLGLPYNHTLRPVLQSMNVDACVFGIPGNTPVDYLATLRFVRDRIDDGAHIAIYIYVYNDFVDMARYLQRTIRGLSPSFVKLTELINYFDDWRRTTFVQGYLRSLTTTPKPPLKSWRLQVEPAKEIKVYWRHEPSRYLSEGPLKREQRATFQFFLDRLQELVADRPWKVSIVLIPDNEEILTNLARPPSTFQDLDPRRVEGLKICVEHWSHCGDLTPYLFERTVAAGRSPYLTKDRHFSLFGNRVLAEHYVATAKLRRAESL